jgi:hypothetical protein
VRWPRRQPTWLSNTFMFDPLSNNGYTAIIPLRGASRKSTEPRGMHTFAGSVATPPPRTGRAGSRGKGPLRAPSGLAYLSHFGG